MIELATGNRWAQTEWGERNHARTESGWVLCGLPQGCAYPADPDGVPCARCVEMAGPAMPPPPGGWPAGTRARHAPRSLRLALEGRAAVDGPQENASPEAAA